MRCVSLFDQELQILLAHPHDLRVANHIRVDLRGRQKSGHLLDQKFLAPAVDIRFGGPNVVTGLEAVEQGLGERHPHRSIDRVGGCAGEGCPVRLRRAHAGGCRNLRPVASLGNCHTLVGGSQACRAAFRSGLLSYAFATAPKMVSAETVPGTIAATVKAAVSNKVLRTLDKVNIPTTGSYSFRDNQPAADTTANDTILNAAGYSGTVRHFITLASAVTKKAQCRLCTLNQNSNTAAFSNPGKSLTDVLNPWRGAVNPPSRA